MKLILFGLLFMAGGIIGFLYANAPPRKEIPYIPVDGIVTGKQWIPEDMQIITIYGSDGLPSTIPIWYPERWVIYISSRSKDVSKEEFQKIEIGKYWKEGDNGTRK